MIVVDTSVWADHFRSPDPHLVFLWNQGAVLQHPMVTGELAMGNLRDWADTVRALQLLPQVVGLSQSEVLTFIADHRLMGCGMGLVDAHILASVAQSKEVSLWTRDKRLAAQAERMGLAHRPD